MAADRCGVSATNLQQSIEHGELAATHAADGRVNRNRVVAVPLENRRESGFLQS